jgi:tRNA(Arg) A34 adenosine deaminase TadA
MRREIFDFFRIAGITAQSKSDIGPIRNFMIGAVGIRNDGAIVKSPNAPTECPNRNIHAEKKLCQKLDYNAVVYVARVKYSDGSFAISRPCPDCLRALISKKVKRIYYTIDDKSYGIISPGKSFNSFHEERKIIYSQFEL